MPALSSHRPILWLEVWGMLKHRQDDFVSLKSLWKVALKKPGTLAFFRKHDYLSNYSE